MRMLFFFQRREEDRRHHRWQLKLCRDIETKEVIDERDMESEYLSCIRFRRLTPPTVHDKNSLVLYRMRQR